MKKILERFLSFFRKFPELLVFVLSLGFLLALEASWRQYAIDRVYFQKWTSEDMMQTLPIIDLRDHPVKSLANLHIQPPALDFNTSAFGAALARSRRSFTADFC